MCFSFTCELFPGGSSDGQGNIGCPPLRLGNNQRRDCWPWSGANQSACEARGCVWCPVTPPGIPWCFMNDEVCPSEIPESSRQDCYPESGSREIFACRGVCLWCPTKTVGVLGVSKTLLFQRVAKFALQTLPITTESTVIPRMVQLMKRVLPGVVIGVRQRCRTPRGASYHRHMGTVWSGSPTVTAKGFQVILNRVRTPSWYGGDIDRVTLDAEFQADYRLRVKVGSSFELVDRSCHMVFILTKYVTNNLRIQCISFNYSEQRIFLKLVSIYLFACTLLLIQLTYYRFRVEPEMMATPEKVHGSFGKGLWGDWLEYNSIVRPCGVKLRSTSTIFFSFIVSFSFILLCMTSAWHWMMTREFQNDTQINPIYWSIDWLIQFNLFSQSVK